jgi:hypothetical protein
MTNVLIENHYMFRTHRPTSGGTPNIGLVHKFVRFLTLPNNLFFTQIIKRSINYVLSSSIHDCLPTFGHVFDPSLGEIHRFGREEFVEQILELRVVAEGNSAQIVGERERERESGRGGNPMGQGPESRADVEESPSRVPEWQLSSCL